MKRITAILSVILILALCLSFAACGEKSDASDGKSDAAQSEPGVKIGDQFAFQGNTIELCEIEDGASVFGSSGSATGKWVTLKFKFVGDGDMAIEYKGFSIDGKDASNAVGTVTKDGLVLAVLFDLDKDADLDNLHLTVE